MKRTLALLAVGTILVSASLAQAYPLQLAAGHRARITAQLVAQKADLIFTSVRFDRFNRRFNRAASLDTMKRLDSSAHRFLRILASGRTFNLRPALLDLELRFSEAKQSFPFLRHS